MNRAALIEAVSIAALRHGLDQGGYSTEGGVNGEPLSVRDPDGNGYLLEVRALPMAVDG